MNQARIARIGQWLCLVGAAIGGICFLTQVLRNLFLNLFVAQGPTMPANSALAVALIGTAGALRRGEEARGARLAFIWLASLVVLAIGLGTITEYAFDVDLGIDRLLPWHMPSGSRPSPFAALVLTLLSCAVLLFDFGLAERSRPSEWLVVGSGLLGFIAFLGMLFGAAPLYFMHGTPQVAIALPTTVSIMLIATGLLIERPAAGLMRVATSPGPGGILLRRLSAVAILVPTLLGAVIARFVRVVGIENFHLAFAVLAVAMAVSSLIFLATTAVPLNHTHEALEASRTQTAELIEQAADGIFLADVDGRYIDVNRAGCLMLGFERHEIVGKTIFDLIPAEDCERLLQSKAEMLKGESHVAEWKLHRKDGSWLFAEVSAKILPNGVWQGLVRDISERKLAEQRARQAQERLELALRGADLASWDWNVATGEVVFNARWAEMRGFGPEEVEPHVRSWISGVHPDDWPRVERAVQDCFAQVTPDYETEHRIRTKSGEWIWILDRGRVFSRDDMGRPTRMVGTELDITERKHAEAALQLSEAKSSGILSISADAVISIDEAQRITMYNEGAEKIFGYSKKEALGAPLDMLIPERLRAKHRRHVERFASGSVTARRMGEPEMQIRGLRKNGQEFPADGAISKLEVGGRQLLTVSLRDISEQKRLEREQRFLVDAGAVLATSLDYEETLIRIAKLAVRDLADFCIVDVAVEDGELRRLKALAKDPAKEWACEILMRNPPDGKREELIRSAIRTGRASLIDLSPEIITSLAQNEEQLRAFRAIDAQSSIVAPLVARGTLLGVIGLVASKPARGFDEVDLRLADELAHRAALSIDNARLYSKAQQAIRTRDDVLGVVAHDLRNPLSTVRMQAALLRRPGAEPERRSSKAADAIERAATRMGRLVSDLLDVTQLEAGHLSIEPLKVPARKILTDAVEAQRMAFEQASIELGLEVGQDLPDVWADRDRLTQILENLIGNACKFTQAGGRVVAGALPRDGEVLFWVRDNGPGIASSDLPHVFDRFWQAQKADRQGAGLGLPIVKGLVEAHGGRIWLESTLGRGTTFFFTIPTSPHAELWRHPTAPRA